MNTQFRKGAIEMCILALIGIQERYGYELVQAIGRYTEINEGTVYPILPGGVCVHPAGGKPPRPGTEILPHHAQGKKTPGGPEGRLVCPFTACKFNTWRRTA